VIIADAVERALSAVPSPIAYLLVFAVPALEASVFLGFVFPGETAAVLGGVLAYQHRASLLAVALLVISGAIIGDSIGYEVGRRLGSSIRSTRLGRAPGEDRWERTVTYIQGHGGPAVLLGRFTAVLRALVPAAAGASGLPYRTFLIWNVTGGLIWGTAFVVLGYLAGTTYHRVERYAGAGGLLVLVAVVGFVAVGASRERRNRRPRG